MQTYGHAELLEAFRRHNPNRKSCRVIFDVLWRKYSEGKNSHLSASQVVDLKRDAIRIFVEKYENQEGTVPMSFLTRVIRNVIVSGNDLEGSANDLVYKKSDIPASEIPTDTIEI